MMIFNFATREWKSLHPQGTAPSARHSHTAVVHNGSMFIYGGIGTGSNTLGSIFKYDFERNTWEEIVPKGGEKPEERWGHTAIMNEATNSMIIFGGYGNQFYNDLFEFRFETQMWHKLPSYGKKPLPRQFHSAVLRDKKMYVTGGFAVKNNHNELYQYNLETCTWTMLCPPPVALRGHTAVHYDKDMIMFGGFDARQSNDIFVYNYDSDTWHTLEGSEFEHAPQPRHFHSAVIHDKHMYVFGGFSMKQNKNDLHRFCFEAAPGEKPKTVIDDYRTLVDNQKFSDILFLVQGSPIYAHKVILYTRSDYFRPLIDNGMKESQMNQIELNDITPSLFRLILEYIYTGQVSAIDADNAVDLLIAADRYLLHSLKTLIQQALVRVISPDNVVDFLEISDQYQCTLLREKCIRFVQQYHPQFEAPIEWNDTARQALASLSFQKKKRSKG